MHQVPTPRSSAPASTTVLVIEDNELVRSALRLVLEGADFCVIEAPDARTALERAGEHRHDVALLDLNLPDGDGFEVLRRLGEADSAPVIVVTGRVELADRLRGFDLGATDYVLKPFYGGELVARLQRAVGPRRVPKQDTSTPNAPFHLDRLARVVRVHGQDLDLTAKEFDLLARLIDAEGRAVSRGELLRTVWNSAEAWQTTATVTEHVYRVRGKLELVGVDPACVTTVRGVGYSYDPSVFDAPLLRSRGPTSAAGTTEAEQDDTGLSEGEEASRLQTVDDIVRWLQASLDGLHTPPNALGSGTRCGASDAGLAVRVQDLVAAAQRAIDRIQAAPVQCANGGARSSVPHATS
jgi:two-component system phosphate regulon response regulator PhoB